MVLILNEKDILKILNMKETISIIEEAFLELSNGTVEMPPRQIMLEPKKNGWIAVMSAYIKNMKALATKVVTVYPDNPQINIPTTIASIVLNDPDTGKPLSILNGGYLTAIRTGAISGVATKYLARNNSHIVGIFGASVQARTQLEAIVNVRKINEVYVYDVFPNASKRFAQEMSRNLDISITSVDNPVKCVKGCDIIATATTSQNPIFDGKIIEQGTHINAVGSHMANRRELDTTSIKSSKVIVDSKEAALKEYGEFIIPLNKKLISHQNIYCELSDIVSGKKEGRNNDEEITVFKSGGLAIQDTAVAYLAYTNALKLGIGTEIDL